MKGPDFDRERSEQLRTLADFLTLYNENLPVSFPRATSALLREFKDTHVEFFKATDQWSLNLHRKRVMDWLPSRCASLDQVEAVSG